MKYVKKRKNAISSVDSAAEATAKDKTQRESAVSTDSTGDQKDNKRKGFLASVGSTGSIVSTNQRREKGSDSSVTDDRLPSTPKSEETKAKTSRKFASEKKQKKKAAKRRTSA
jgi:hypothetical protein